MMKSGVLCRSFLGIVSFLAVSAFTIVENVSEAQMVSARQIYAYAKAGNANALYNLYGYLDAQDSKGNTALCMAVMDDNLQAYNLLKQYGANTQPNCLSAALAGGSSSSTFLGMGSTGWIATGVVVAAGAGVAVAAGGGGGGGGGGGSDTPTKCVHGKVVDNKCVCDTGWTGTDCSSAVNCGSGYKVSCAANEYSVAGDTCKSGDATLKKCVVHSVMPNCNTFKTDEDACLVCKEGWSGKKCEAEYDCGSEYKGLCGKDEYSVAGDTCKSGEQTLIKCKAHSSMPNCDEFRTDEDTCKTCKEGWTGSKCESAVSCGTDYAVTCGENFYADESDTCKSGEQVLKKCKQYSSMPNCDVFKTDEDACATCKSGWTGNKCETPATCEGYSENCAVDEYSVAGDTCDSGGKVLKKCVKHSSMPNCDVFSTDEDTCKTCKEGWSGKKCEAEYDCGASFAEECSASQYTNGDTCPSGSKILKKCIDYSAMPNCDELDPNDDKCLTCKEGWVGDQCKEAADCGAGYKESCTIADEYMSGETCPSGGKVLNECIERTNKTTKCDAYNPSADACQTCRAGWHGDSCETENTCDPQYKDECSPNQYATENVCPKGDQVLKECKDHSSMDGRCKVFSTTEDICLECKPGWTGDKCEEESSCAAEYKLSCSLNDEYSVDSDTCESGGKILTKCEPRTNKTEKCSVYNPSADACQTCVEGWLGDTCDTPVNCEGNYKEVCSSDEYVVAGDTCKSGDDTLIKCEAHTPVENCDEYSPTANECQKCKAGWTGAKCDEAVNCGDGYKEECTEGVEYTSGLTCDSGGKTLKKCIKYKPMPNCYEFDPTDDKCNVCKDGWIGDDCSTPKSCDGFKLGCDEGEFDTGATCKSGNDDLHQCQAYTPVENCEKYSDYEDACQTCKEGWVGVKCDEPVDCGDGYRSVCQEGEYEDVLLTCKSGNETLKRCEQHSVIEHCDEYSTTSDSCVKCTDGWSGDYCTIANDCGDDYRLSCDSDEYIDSSAGTCKSGDNNLVKCAKHSIMPNCEVMSTTEDVCSTCRQGYTGTKCEQENVCSSEYKQTCGENEYMDYGDTCWEGDLYKMKCKAYTDMPNCEKFSVGSDSCDQCKDGWAGKHCTVESTCGSNFKEECPYYEYTGTETCVAGELTLKECKAYSDMPHCWFRDPNADACLFCETGWGGDKCNTPTSVNNSTEINISDSADNAYGIMDNEAFVVTNEETGSITITGTQGIEAIGINQGDLYSDVALIENKGTIDISSSAHDAYGIRASFGTVNNVNTGSISVSDTGDNAYGIYAGSLVSDAVNRGEINMSSNNGVTFGMYAEPCATITNAAGGVIVISDNTGTAYGMYAANGEAENHTLVNNDGSIVITGTDDAYGIYAAGPYVTVRNTGYISINGSSCTGADCKDDNRFIKLNGATFEQNGILMSDVIKLDSYGGEVVASDTSHFVANDISGNLTMSSKVVKDGFDDTYTVQNMITAGNTDALNLQSQSALFDATLENNGDAVLKMKSFDEVVENQSIAEFLKQNYAQGNNESLFNDLKDQRTVTELNDTIRELSGSDVFNRFAFEDLTMMRELNMDMNNTLFTNEKKYLETSGSVTPWNFDGNSGSNARYALYNNRSGNKSFGLGVAFSDVRSNSGKDSKNSRYDQTFQVSAPLGYRKNGFRFITSPRLGYAYGTYDREGYQGRNYDGKVEKRMFGLMNEVRYPIRVGKWSMAPSAEFNMLGYNVKGHEDAQKYALNIKSQNNYSVESGFGLYANREFKHGKNGLLKFNVGMAVYHEFADPYSLELQMRGMDGTYKVRDERRKDNRAVIRTGFDYKWSDDIMFTGSFASYLDGTTHNNANLDFKHKF